MNTKRYIYENVEILRIIDGDTIVVNIDLGFNIWKKATLRLYGINAPEIKGTEKELGLKSKEYVSSLIPINSYVKLECLGKDKYGRWLANIYKDELFINQHLIYLKYAFRLASMELILLIAYPFCINICFHSRTRSLPSSLSQVNAKKARKLDSFYLCDIMSTEFYRLRLY